MGEPLLAVAVAEAVALGAGVVLVDDGAPPLDHLVLDVDRARGRSVDAGDHRRHVVTVADLLGQLQHPHEHGGDHLRLGDPVLLDEAEELLGIEVLHHHQGSAHDVDAHAEAQRRGVVERRRRQVAGVRAVAEQQLAEAGHQARCRLQRLRVEPLEHPLGPSGRSRAVEHVGAGHAVGQGIGGDRLDGRLVGVVALDGAVEHEPQLHAGHLVPQLGRLFGLVGRGDERPGTAVVDDVGHLLGGEPARHRRVDQPRVRGAPCDRQEAGVVLQAEGHVVAGPQAHVVEHPRQPVGLLVEFGVGDDPPRGGHHDRGMVGALGGMGSWVQGLLLVGSVIWGSDGTRLRRRRRRSGQ